MVKGLVIGKFMPPHKGHLALIKFASKRCDQLIVAVCSRPGQEISSKLRYQWMKILMKGFNNVKLVQIRARLPQDKRSTYKASKPWAYYCLKRFGTVDKIFSSEKYGKYMAKYMGSEYIDFDPKRKKFPVSGTDIRKHPFKFWKYIPLVVRPYFVKTVCVYGPESTGKTTLARALARKFRTKWAPEYARKLIASQGDKFSYSDFSKFVSGQIRTEKIFAKKANKVLFCDTDPITTEIYSKHYYGKVPDQVKRAADKSHHDYYLFCDIDLPWKKDPQRDLGDRRVEFKNKFLGELKTRKRLYSIVTGVGPTRLVNASRFLLKRYPDLISH